MSPDDEEGHVQGRGTVDVGDYVLVAWKVGEVNWKNASLRLTV